MALARYTWTSGLAAALLAAGCSAHVRPPPREPVLERPFRAAAPPPPPADYPDRPGAAPASTPRGGAPLSPKERGRVTALASGLVGAWNVVVEGRRHRADCSGLVQAVYEAVGVDLTAVTAAPDENGVSLIYRFVADRGGVYRGGRPAPGDLVFFHDTWDRNGDGRRNDPLTHVGIVERVEADGTVVVLHHSRRGVVRSRMNLERPAIRRDRKSGKRLNDYLRRGRSGPRLMGELFAGYGTVLR